MVVRVLASAGLSLVEASRKGESCLCACGRERVLETWVEYGS